MFANTVNFNESLFHLMFQLQTTLKDDSTKYENTEKQHKR
jgi:hypothetical protein